MRTGCVMTKVLLSAWSISWAEAVGMMGQSLLLYIFAPFFSFGFLGPFARGLLLFLDSKCIFGNFIYANVFMDY